MYLLLLLKIKQKQWLFVSVPLIFKGCVFNILLIIKIEFKKILKKILLQENCLVNGP